ncbi:MAG: flavodoxin family protein [Firmicutes bacterium]|nr:flavodoxin family protein [Bacillota bacterium]
MKIIGVACSGLDRSVSRKMIEAFLKGAEEAGHETELILIHQDRLGCTGCKGCKNKDSFCVRQDVLTHYFEALPEADAVVLGFGIYMGYPQGEAWTFMNRHYCLHKSFVGGECKIRPGKKLFCMVAQGAPDNPQYRENCDAVLKPFDGWGFDRQPVLVASGREAEAKIQEAYELGKRV